MLSIEFVLSQCGCPFIPSDISPLITQEYCASFHLFLEASRFTDLIGSRLFSDEIERET